MRASPAGSIVFSCSSLPIGIRKNRRYSDDWRGRGFFVLAADADDNRGNLRPYRPFSLYPPDRSRHNPKVLEGYDFRNILGKEDPNLWTTGAFFYWPNGPRGWALSLGRDCWNAISEVIVILSFTESVFRSS